MRNRKSAIPWWVQKSNRRLTLPPTKEGCGTPQLRRPITKCACLACNATDTTLRVFEGFYLCEKHYKDITSHGGHLRKQVKS